MNATIAKLNRLTREPGAAPDGALLAAFLTGDQGAFAALVRRHAGLVFATCRRVLRHQQDAEDAFQATFLVLARRAADVWPREAVGSWLFGVAHRVALKARAVQSRRAARERPLEDAPSAEPGRPDPDLAEAVHRAVCRLPEIYRAAVVACDLQGLSRKEAAERLGWSEGTLSGRLARARVLLGARLRRLGLSLPASGLAVFAVTEGASASALQSALDFATGTGASVSAPVAALTEGVVRSMAVFKLKAMVAVVFAACALGYGAFAAGAGTGDGPGAQQSQGAPAAPVAKPIDPPAKPLARIEKPAPDLAPLQGSWRVVSIGEGDKVALTEAKESWVVEISGATMRMPIKDATGGVKTREYKLTVDGAKSPKTIDLISPNDPVGRGIYEFVAPGSCAKCHAGLDAGRKVPPTIADVCDPELKNTKLNLRLALSVNDKRPTKFSGEGVIVFEMVPAETEAERLMRYGEMLDAQLKKAIAQTEAEAEDARRAALVKRHHELLAQAREANARQEMLRAQAQLAEAQARVKVSRVQVAAAEADLKDAQDKLAAAEKVLADLKKPQPGAPAKDGEVFTVHVRTLTAAEKVIRVKATGKGTVLEGLVHAADDIPIMTGTVSVWVVRGKEVLPVDLPAITKNGDAKTNYVLKPGDQLFVQVKSEK